MLCPRTLGSKKKKAKENRQQQQQKGWNKNEIKICEWEPENIAPADGKQAHKQTQG